MSRNSTTRDHLETSREAGLGRVSVISVLAGLITAYGAFAIVAAIVGAVLSKVNVDTDFRTNDWTGSGAVALLATAISLLLAYLFGGYVAGRMARRAGVLHGILVFVATLVVGAIVGGLVALLTDDDSIRSNLRSIGVPTSTSQVKGVAIVGVAVSLGAILVGAVIGGILGERWHTNLARRAADPEIGPAAEARQRAVEEDERRTERLARDPIIGHDARRSDPDPRGRDRSDDHDRADPRPVSTGEDLDERRGDGYRDEAVWASDEDTAGGPERRDTAPPPERTEPDR